MANSLEKWNSAFQTVLRHWARSLGDNRLDRNLYSLCLQFIKLKAAIFEWHGDTKHQQPVSMQFDAPSLNALPMSTLNFVYRTPAKYRQVITMIGSRSGGLQVSDNFGKMEIGKCCVVTANQFFAGSPIKPGVAVSITIQKTQGQMRCECKYMESGWVMKETQGIHSKFNNLKGCFVIGSNVEKSNHFSDVQRVIIVDDIVEAKYFD